MTIPSNLHFELLGVLVLLLLTPTCPNYDKDITGQCIIPPKHVDRMLAWAAVLVILHEFVWLFFIVGKHACTYPTRCIIT